MAITWHRLTLEDFLKLPEAEPPLEYLQGQLRQTVQRRGDGALLDEIAPGAALDVGAVFAALDAD